MSEFGNRLKELVFDKQKTVSEICSEINLDTSVFYKWWGKSSVPNIDHLILLANYFNCSLDFLVGRIIDDYPIRVNNELPAFGERLKFLVKNSDKSVYYLCKTSKIHKGSFMRWQNGQFFPLLDNLLKLADYFKCSLDYLVGREN